MKGRKTKVGTPIWEDWKKTRFKLIEESVRNQLWTKHNRFSEKKAFVASLLSQLAYIHVTEFERKNLKRTKLIPSELFHLVAQSGEFINLTEEFRRIRVANESIDVAIIETRKAVAVTTRILDTFFITIRGTTKDPMDVIVDLSAWKKGSSTSYHLSGVYHHGFLKEATQLYDEILLEIEKQLEIKGTPQKIVLTGHSLGAALATHISLWIHNHMIKKSYICNIEAYLFGTPRIGDEIAMEEITLLHNFPHGFMPFFIYNIEDPVPMLPPRKFGYSDFPLEYPMQADGFISDPSVPVNTRDGIHIQEFKLKNFKFHSMETYIQRLESKVLS